MIWINMEYERERHRDWLREIEHERLVRAAKAGQPRRSDRVRVLVSRWLMVWSATLKARWMNSAERRAQG
jgi:hypothetical protein